MKKEEDEDSVIINEDLFEQVSDEEQIIQNEGRDEECSFFSNKSNKNLNANKNKAKSKSKNRNNIGNNINNQDKIINIKNININNDINNINNYDFKIENNIIIEESSDINSNNFNTYSNNNNLTNNNNNNENYENNNDNENNFQYNKNIYTKVNIGKNINKNADNNKTKNLKKLIYKKQKISKGKDKGNNKIIPNITGKNNTNIVNSKENKSNKKQIKLPLIKGNNNSNEKEKSQEKEKDKKSFIKKMKDKAFNDGRNNLITKTNISYDKFGNKNLSKNKDSKDNKNNIERTNYKKRMNYISNYKEKNNYKKISPKNIKLSKKVNKSYNNTNHLMHHEKSKSNFSYKSNSPQNLSKNIKKINLTNAKISQDITNKSSLISGNSSSVITQEKKKFEHDTNVLKKILINKINNQISEIIRGREKMYFNDNKNLFFLGFCDIMFELGFLHIKETEISDITQIDKHINDLYTQPYTNRALLSESFLYNEQHLLICAWKTILNNFELIKEFDDLPQEKEEITLDDCKLFIFIITGLFIGFNNNKINYDNSSNNTERKIMTKNKSVNNFNLPSKIRKEKDSMEKNLSRDKMSQSYTKNKSRGIFGKQNKYHFRNKSGNNKDNNKYTNNNSDENILKAILDNRKKSNYNYKSILKIKNYFNYFAELRKLFNLYQKDLKNYTKKVTAEKDLTFYPKTNKNNTKLINKFAPSLNFFERSALIKNRNDQKKIIIQRERSQKMMKECTFEPGKQNHKINKLPLKNIKEISNRLYLNNSYRKQRSEIASKKNSSHRMTEDLTNSENDNSRKKIYSKELIRSNNKVKKFNYTNYNSSKNKNKNNGDMFNLKASTSSAFSKVHTDNTNYTSKSKEIFNFSPNINKNFNRAMFSQSPLYNDDLVNKRIKNLRESNFKRILNNYEKNNREIISNEVKNNKKLLKELILAENKQMRMDNEKRTNKDTFENFINYDILYDNNLYDNQISANNEPLFTVEIKIKDSIKTIEVYQGDVPEKLAYDFCVDNFLGKASFEKIVTIIKAKLEEINNWNFNEDINYYNTSNKNEQNEEILENENDNDNYINENENYENYEEEDENHIENINSDNNDNIYEINENIENNIEENDKDEDDKDNEINFNEINQNNFNEGINDNNNKDEKYSDNNILENENNNMNNYNDNNFQEKLSSNINNNTDNNFEEDNYERINEEDEINDDYQIDNHIQSFNNINNIEEINEVKESEVSDSNNDIINK